MNQITECVNRGIDELIIKPINDWKIEFSFNKWMNECSFQIK